jgi:hypothetical protein
MSAPLPGDKQAGFTGLIVAVVVLGCVLYGIVRLTSAHYAREAAAKPAAAASQ